MAKSSVDPVNVLPVIVPEGCFLDPRFHSIESNPEVWKSITKQSFADEVDINKIVDGFMKSGFLPQRAGSPFYGDVSDISDYQDCLNKVIEAQGLFNSMPANIRDRFNNDPAALIAFLDNPANLDEAVSLGMVVKRPVEPVEALKPVKEG